MPIKVYGASDDLIEVEGSVREEFTAYGNEKRHLLAFSTGHVVACLYDDDGCWRTLVLATPKSGTHSITPGDPTADERDDGTPGYSDVLTIDADPVWCVYGSELARA